MQHSATQTSFATPTTLRLLTHAYTYEQQTGPLTTVEKVKFEKATKAANALVQKHHAMPMGTTVLVKTELCGLKKKTPVVEQKEHAVRAVCDSVLRAAMPRSGPMHLPYNDVLDISMYMEKEITNEYDMLCPCMVF